MSPEVAVPIIIIGVSVLLTAVPIWIAVSRRSAHLFGIVMVAIFFGWTLIGLVGAIIWAVMSPAKANVRSRRRWSQQPSRNEDKACPQCAEMIKRGANVCRFCGHSFAGLRVALPARRARAPAASRD